MQCVRVFVEFYAFNHFLKYTYAHSRTILACLALVERRCTNATRFQKDIRQTDEHTYTSNGRGRGSSNGRIFIWTRHAVVVSHPFTHSIVSSYRRRRIELVQAILLYDFCFYFLVWASDSQSVHCAALDAIHLRHLQLLFFLYVFSPQIMKNKLWMNEQRTLRLVQHIMRRIETSWSPCYDGC